MGSSEITMKVPFFLCLILVGVCIKNCQAGEDDEYDKRCKYFSFLSACKVGCKALGHTTGVCDENDKCFCSEEDYNFFHDVTLWLGKLDISEVVKRQINKFQRKIGVIAKEIKNGIANALVKMML